MTELGFSPQWAGVVAARHMMAKKYMDQTIASAKTAKVQGLSCLD